MEISLICYSKRPMKISNDVENIWEALGRYRYEACTLELLKGHV